MKNFLLSIITIIMAASCGNDPKPDSSDGKVATDTLTIINDPKNNLNIQTASFVVIDTSGMLMFPLSIGETARSGGKSYYKEMPSSTYWNIIFYNSRSKEYHLLTDRKVLIDEFTSPYENNQDHISDKHIFYTVTTDDLNSDKKLTDEDPKYLFVSDKHGNNFRQLSPSGSQLNNWKLLKSGKLILAATTDSDKNKKFDDYDEIITYEIELDKGTAATEIFSNDFKNKLKILFDKDWKRVKSE